MRNDHDQPRTRSGEPDPEAIEPEVDPDAGQRVFEERPDPAHGPSRFDAGTDPLRPGEYVRVTDPDGSQWSYRVVGVTAPR